jgi:uncharacterized protein YlxW (UPF0749 family)
MKMNKTTISFTVVLLILGLVISMQFKTQQDIRNTLEHQNPADLVAIYRAMEARETELLETLSDLRQRRIEILDAAREEDLLIYQVQREIEQLKLLSGEVPVSGPGINVTISDTTIWHIDLVDLVNELWATSAEAIAINNHRVTANTHIQRNSAGEILLNNEILSFPIVVTAIGDPHTLEMGLIFRGGLMDNWETFHAIRPIVTARERVSIPAISIQETMHRP